MSSSPWAGPNHGERFTGWPRKEGCSSCLGVSTRSPGAWPSVGGGGEPRGGWRGGLLKLPSQEQDMRLWVMEATGRCKVGGSAF